MSPRGRDSATIRTDVAPAIRVRHVSHRFGAREVLNDVTFDVYPGEIFGFIGPNGAGKTTTIRIMATLLDPASGRVEIGGTDVSMDPEVVRRMIGYMPDHAGVYERITVREFLEFFADAHEVASPKVVGAVLELTDIANLADQLVASLSKGQKQRLQLARILLHDPEVLILDEPASDLDPRARIEIRDLLLDLQSLGKTILLSSHILSELADVCTSVGIIEHGRMVAAGPIDQIGAQVAQRNAALQLGHPSSPSSLGISEGVGRVAVAGGGAVGSDVPGRRIVKLRVLGDLTAAAYALHGNPGILEVTVVGRAVQVGFVGGDEMVAQMVAHLVHRGFGVVGVEQERSELERIFLEATSRSTKGGTA